MSLNNVLPAWLFELDEILISCESCPPGDRAEVYMNAFNKLDQSETIPKHVKHGWMQKIKYGITWEVPRRMK